ncbi:hypothetical protein BAE44_0022345 [Dichanthelium oligosanthes]|uniref:FHA domain-containing protein n=1 Tax=Dichanthelium oligosanthes TaxID=888268 RepID=A0A1E5UUU1_9POAL|nr:hypothetical protein BAE44_0022345 [Dichanthelium oligosanthes]
MEAAVAATTSSLLLFSPRRTPTNLPSPSLFRPPCNSCSVSSAKQQQQQLVCLAVPWLNSKRSGTLRLSPMRLANGFCTPVHFLNHTLETINEQCITVSNSAAQYAASCITYWFLHSSSTSESIRWPVFACPFPLLELYMEMLLRNKTQMHFALSISGDGDWRHIGYKVARPGAFEIDSDAVTVGRVPDKADIVLPVATVSGTHARLEEKF